MSEPVAEPEARQMPLPQVARSIELPPEPASTATRRIDRPPDDRRELPDAGRAKADNDRPVSKISVPADASRFGGHSYKFFPDVLSWHRAKARCLQMGGHLVTIGSREENDFVLGLALRGIARLGPLDGVWLGATDEAEERAWGWVDGSRFSFAAWGPGQPNNKQDREHYLLLFLPRNEWSDQPDVSTQHVAYFVCEWDGPGQQTRSQSADVTIFNGRDLTGWSPFFPGGPTRAEDEFAVGASGDLTLNGRHNGYLGTEVPFRDFELSLDSRFPRGGRMTGSGSGVLLGLGDGDGWLSSGFEVQIVGGNCGDLWVSKGYRFEGESREGRYGRVRKQRDAERPIGEWNRYEIRCEGEKVVVKLNGELVNERIGNRPIDGRIGLISSGTDVEFRVLRLRQIDK